MEWHLSPKQQQVCELLSKGKNNQEIANAMGISRRTVEEHRETVYKKLGVRNAVELTRKFLGIQDEQDSY